MPVYDHLGNPVAALAAIDTLIDDGATKPLAILSSANFESAYNALTAFFGTQPALTLDGSDNITTTTLEWTSLMHWATQGYSAADDYNSTILLDYILELLQEQANTSGIPPPYWKNVSGVVLTLTQPEVLTWLLYALRALYKAAGFPAPVQVP